MALRKSWLNYIVVRYVESKKAKKAHSLFCCRWGRKISGPDEIIEIAHSGKTKVDLQELRMTEDSVLRNANGKPPYSIGPSTGVLVVEDNADMRHYICKTLSDQYQIIEAENGKTGVTLAKEICA